MIICENCGKTFESAWTDAEAAAEYAIEFPDQPPAEQGAVVCDQCYERMMAMFRPRQMN